MADTLELKAGANVTLTEDGENVVISAKDTIPVVDSEMSATSANAVQNKTVYAELAKKQNVLTAGEGIAINDNVIKSTDGVTVDPELSADSSNPVASKAIVAELAKKQGALTAGEGISLSDGVISSTVKAPTVAQTTGDSTTSVMSQKAVTDELEKGKMELTMYRHIGLQDIEKIYFDTYWDGQNTPAPHPVTSKIEKAKAYLIKMPKTRLIYNNLGYGGWNTAWYCDGVNEDGTLVNAVWTQNKNGDNLHDDTHKYIFISLCRASDNNLLQVNPKIGGFFNGICLIEETYSGIEALEKSQMYDAEIIDIVSAFRSATNNNARYNIKVNGDFLRFLSASNISSMDLPLVRHLPYFEANYTPTFESFVNLENIDFGKYGVQEGMFADCMSLDSIKGFKSLEIAEIPKNIFYNCRKLKDIDLPPNVTSIGVQAFVNCKSLALTHLPSGITSIGQNAFEGCTSLALTELPAGLTSIETSSFANCPNLAITELPPNVTSIGVQAFVNCKSLALTHLPSGITSIGRNAFEGCTSLALTELPAGLTSIETSSFANCPNLAITELPPNVTSLGAYVLRSSGGTVMTIPDTIVANLGAFFYGWLGYKVIVGKGITALGSDCFWGSGVNAKGGILVMRSSTPPVLEGTHSFGNPGLTIYVPDDAVDTYKAATNWSKLASRIKPVSEMPTE